MTAPKYELVLFANGTSGMCRVVADSHTGAPYVYARNVNAIWTRVYVAPGESVAWFENACGPSALDFTPAPVAALAA